MASRRVEERDEIEKLLRKTYTDRLSNEVMENTSKTELEVTCMSRDNLRACMMSVRREKKAGT